MIKKSKLFVFGMLLLGAPALGGCALCHGPDDHRGQQMQDRFWDHSNMQW